MALFSNDYLEGCHPLILEKLIETNMVQTPGYGLDEMCEKARIKVKQALQSQECDVHFMVGGTQVNKTVIGALLQPYEGVISVTSGHIATMETGAIESNGNKVITLEGKDGKLIADKVRKYLIQYEEEGGHEHVVKPGLIYISQPTELGTHYTKQELENLYALAKEFRLKLFIDGARLAYCCHEVPLSFYSKVSDVIYIGGTKCGALFGEVVVCFSKINNFRMHMKRQGGLLAKGRLLGIQFETLFTDGLYEAIGLRAVEYSLRIKKAFLDKGYKLYVDSVTNQQFVYLPGEKGDYFRKNFGFLKWHGEQEVYRICTSWATTQENVDKLIKAIQLI